MTHDHPLPYRVERTRNRTSRAVLRGETVVIRLAKGLSDIEERDHVSSLLRRMIAYLERERRRSVINPFRALLQGEQSAVITLANGRSFRFEMIPAPLTRAVPTDRGWRVEVSARIRRRELHRFLWSLLAADASGRVVRLVEEISAQTLGLPVRSVRLTFMSSQWGSCSARGDIRLSTVLLFLPEDLLRYVIVHELAHIRHRNHARAYWAAVERMLPEYRSARSRLRDFRICRL